MAKCDLCGSENPREAIFCMKCGNDLRVGTSDDLPADDSEPDTFTPAASSKDARLASSTARRRRQAPDPSQVEDYKKHAAAQSIAAFESQDHRRDFNELPEIELSAVTADFVNKKKFCDECGASNPYEQRFCQQCGSTLGQQLSEEADPNFDVSPAIPLAPSSVEPFEHLALADLHSAPASDYSREPADARKRRHGSERLASTLAKRGPGQWLLVGATLLVAAALIWLLALGGFDMLFNSKVRMMNRAAGAMGRLTSFQYNVNATLETTNDIHYGGGGRAIHESPDKSLWSMVLDVQGKPITTETVETERKIYINGALLQPSDSEHASGDVTDLWKNFRSVEDLGNQPVGTLNCLHYKYRIPPNMVTTVLGVGKQTAASDAVVEAWIDTSSSQIVKMTMQIFNVQIEGVSTTMLLAMDLAAVGQPYNINAPAQQQAPSSTP